VPCNHLQAAVVIRTLDVTINACKTAGDGPGSMQRQAAVVIRTLMVMINACKQL
jgi:hypothetical protein